MKRSNESVAEIDKTQLNLLLNVVAMLLKKSRKIKIIYAFLGLLLFIGELLEIQEVCKQAAARLQLLAWLIFFLSIILTVCF